MYNLGQIYKSFPRIELSYEKNIHKKIPQEFYQLIPKGPKFYAWFNTYEDTNVCFFLKCLKKRASKETSVQPCCFHNELCSGVGTILYGTKFVFNKTSFFNIEDIIYFKGVNIQKLPFQQKLYHVLSLFKNYLKQVRLCKNDIIFGTPFYDRNINNIISKAMNLPYKIYCIQGIQSYKKCNIFVPINKSAIFLIKAAITPDIYMAYAIKNNKTQFLDYIFIPNYKISVFMNSIFRNIKENYNLDLLEESDDEEEFQNINEDKYVYLDKEIKMKCIFHDKFKKWMPEMVVDSKEKISSYNI